ncbi:MAG: agmatine deiminase family protein, partial [Planctomycetales bacterium]|nr:agmatine deiminase family protein [Planctomycetales bacterium]
MKLSHINQTEFVSQARFSGHWRLALFVVVIGLIVSIVANRILALQYRQVEHELAVVSGNLQSSRERAARLDADLDGYFREIIAQLDQQLIPLDRTARMSLRASKQVCERILTETGDAMRRASAYCTLGHIYRLQNDLKSASDSYRSAVDATSHATAPDASRLRSLAGSYLVEVLAQLGREQEALSTCQQLIRQLQKDMQANVPYRIGLLNELAFLVRNQAVLLASNGDLEQATSLARRHTQILMEVFASSPTDVTLAERVIDAKYLLAGLVWRAPSGKGRPESLALLQEVSEAAVTLRNQAERRLRSGEPYDYGKYKSAVDRASHELKLAQSFASTGGDKLRNPSFWTRKNLYRGRRSIGTEILLDDVRMPAEFETQAAMIVKWSGRDWQDTAITTLVKELASQLQVLILVDDYESQVEARNELAKANVELSNVQFFPVPANTLWVRDYGPITVLGSEGFPIWIDCQHHLSDNHIKNDLLIERLGRLTGHRVIRGPLLLEGGNVVSNGDGLIVCTKHLETDNLKLGYTPQALRKRLRSMVGCRELVVLENLKREPTGHVDWFLTFVSQDTVVVGEYDPKVDSENAKILDANAERLREIRVGTTGTQLNVVRIPMPPHP